ncbi:MAG TPA: hypothetical protein VG387_02070 [Rhizomicrobium sp.]|jgi:hypothetical protein|nr:hypothetical protein [Rhizomicrobium sp.]
MFLYRVKVEELDAARLLSLKNAIVRRETDLRANCPIREMSVIAGAARELDIYLALDDLIEPEQLKRLAGDLNAMIDTPRVSTELIHI